MEGGAVDSTNVAPASGKPSEDADWKDVATGTGVGVLKMFLNDVGKISAEEIKRDCVDKDDILRKVELVLIDKKWGVKQFNEWKKSEQDAASVLLGINKMTISSDSSPALSLESIARGIKAGSYEKIIVMTGAGISVAAGIPDFRTPGTGLYDNLEKYNLPHPTAVFELQYFNNNPKPFFTLAKELYPGCYEPTPVHYFIRYLDEKGLLLRNFTQNIDTLERETGMNPDHIVEAHGSFGSATCVKCRHGHTPEYVKTAVFANDVPKCQKCTVGVVKPDVVFFGEGLPDRFFKLVKKDFPECDLLLVIGTSLAVQPFANLVNYTAPDVPRVLINRDKVGPFFRNEERDLAALGDCQEVTLKLIELLGWTQEYNEQVAAWKQERKDKAAQESATAATGEGKL